MKKLQEFIAEDTNLLVLCNNNKEIAELHKSVFAEFYDLKSDVITQNRLKLETSIYFNECKF